MIQSDVAAIYDEFKNNIAAGTTYWLDQDGPSGPVPGVWCRFNVHDGTTKDTGPGNLRKRDLGKIVCQVFGPPGGGAGALRAIGNDVVGIFENKDVGRSMFQTAEWRHIPADSERNDAYEQMNVMIRFKTTRDS